MPRKGHYDPKDRLFQKAKREGYVSRAAYKLIELHQKLKIFRQDSYVLDLGAAPGSWSQVALEFIGPQGLVLALDLAPLSAQIAQPQHFAFIQGDILAPETMAALREKLAPYPRKMLSTILSDLSPKLSGIAITDHERSLALVRKALDYAREFLATDGNLIVKTFPGEEIEKIRKEMALLFSTVRLLHLDSSRGTSREVYLVALNKKKG